MSSALIGHSGFVGSNILLSENFEFKFNSSNISSINYKHINRIVCAGVQSVKWQANKDPDTDWNGIEKLMNALRTVSADRFTLISTIDVYQHPQNTDETTILSTEKGDAYGRHRLIFEEFIKKQFEQVHIIRLPGLFGLNLRKNVLYDMLQDNRLEFINPESRFQWYDLSRLCSDIKIIEDAGLNLTNLMPEPVETGTIQKLIFPDKKIGGNAGAAAFYDVRTINANIFGSEGNYIYNAEEVLKRIANFVKKMRI
jgi:nucleoside-diphosphate-sugar epimerase